eukprot:486760-Pyramimonas_sp.AAC.1
MGEVRDSATLPFGRAQILGKQELLGTCRPPSGPCSTSASKRYRGGPGPHRRLRKEPGPPHP